MKLQLGRLPILASVHFRMHGKSWLSFCSFSSLCFTFLKCAYKKSLKWQIRDSKTALSAEGSEILSTTVDLLNLNLAPCKSSINTQQAAALCGRPCVETCLNMFLFSCRLGDFGSLGQCWFVQMLAVGRNIHIRFWEIKQRFLFARYPGFNALSGYQVCLYLHCQRLLVCFYQRVSFLLDLTGGYKLFIGYF